MTDSDEWGGIPGFPFYEASRETEWRRDDDGLVPVSGGIRSIDRSVNGRSLTGVVLRARLSNRGYVLINVRDAEGRTQTRSAQSLVLLAHKGPCPPGLEARHLDDNPLNNRWAPGDTGEEVRAGGGNLIWGTKLENAEDKFRNGGRNRAEPKPPRHCIRCSAVLTTTGKRCHACVVEIGQEAAALLWSGVRLDDACERLGYPSEAGLHTLAVKYGGYGAQPQPPAPPVTDSRRRWPSRTLATFRDILRFARGDGA